MPPSVAAVVVTYHPKPAAAEGLRAALDQCASVVVVDNASTDAELAPLLNPRLDVVRNATNLGVAAAQNAGIRRAIEKGASHVLLLDQDSVPEPGMVAALLAACGDGVGIAAPVAFDPGQQKPARFFVSADGKSGEARELDGPVLEGLLFAISSGSLVPVATLAKAGLLLEPYFIDYVDVEFGLRVRKAGLKIVAVRDARLRHRLGDYEERRFFGRLIPVTHHSAKRRFTQTRNRIWTLRLHGRAFPAFRRLERRARKVDGIRLVFFERGRVSKMWAVFRGWCAGLFTSPPRTPPGVPSTTPSTPR